ncbi:hypothetical protein TNCV_3624751 [Trichonephila clavipes]|nr:hypothetical protein TNCV_3624751 [Trichonephila clavipes]
MTPFQLLTGVKMRTKQDLEILKLLEEEIVETFTENREKFGRKPMKHSEDARRKTVEILIRNGKRHTSMRSEISSPSNGHSLELA